MNNNLLLVLARHKNGEKVYLFESEVAISEGKKLLSILFGANVKR